MTIFKPFGYRPAGRLPKCLTGENEMAYGYINAFPDNNSGGLTKREYFAAHAPAVTDKQVIADVDGYPEFDNSGYFYGRPNETILAEQKKKQYEWLKKARIKWRWQYADMMIEEI